MSPPPVRRVSPDNRAICCVRWYARTLVAIDEILRRLELPPVAVYEHRAKPWLENERIHPMERHRRTKQWRGDWHMLGLANRARPAVPVVIVVDLDVKRRAGKLPDPHSVSPTAKACVDGLVDAGVLPNDGTRQILAYVFRSAQWADRDALRISVHALPESSTDA